MAACERMVDESNLLSGRLGLALRHLDAGQPVHNAAACRAIQTLCSWLVGTSALMQLVAK